MPGSKAETRFVHVFIFKCSQVAVLPLLCSEAVMAVVNLSFAACGFLGIYHLGTIDALLTHGHRLLSCLRACTGASAGALVAAVLITAPDKLEHCKEFTYRFASNVRKQTLGAMTPGYDFMLELRGGIEHILPPDAHLLASERLHVSLTNCRTGRNSMVSSFPSREHLIKVLLASSFVPLYAGVKPVEFQGQVSERERLSKRLSSELCVCVRVCLIHSELLQDGQFQPVCQMAVCGCTLI
ncbi:patatin-like phospholipase domain-containing protein 4 isoform X2 [Ictalurus punctatus]|uniref:Patatin-like phospholipase domain-containing protein 4 isoform X2 n=1 Tax=Ictalurus punctatus TaxID=7998 RepID=A0A2D0Q4K8_ICTPU|nr:patatin-like phospholipase domain-containing protein 4 isoform X2 [Ictalurus punctatus]